MLSKHLISVPNVVGVHGELYGTWWCDLPGGVQGKAPNAPAILKYSKPENSSFWSVLYRASNPKLAKDNFERHDERLQIKREILFPKK